jgi:hypothetical protein
MGEHDDDLDTSPAALSEGESEATRVAAAVASGLKQVALAIERGLQEVAQAIASADTRPARRATHKR